MFHPGTKTWPVVYLGLVPVLGYIALIAILHVALPHEVATSLVFDPPVLMLVLNTLFLSGVSFAVSTIVARAYLASGFANILLLGCGILALGGAALAGGWVRPLGGTANTSVTIHNLGVLLGAILHCMCALQTLLKSGPEHILARRRQKLLTGFVGTLILIVLIAAATVYGRVPQFWAAGLGSTPLKQAVLGTAIALFGLTSVYSMVLYSQNRRGFFYWYSLALALTSIGLIGVTAMKAVGDPIAWAGRTAQYLGGIYFLLAALRALREARAQGLTLEMEIDRFYRQSELHYRDLVDIASDAIISVDEKRRVLLWNHGAERMLGYTPAEAAGCMLDDLLMPKGHKGRIDNAFQEFQKRIVSPFAATALETAMRRKDGTLFTAETALSMRRTDLGWTATLVVRDITARKQLEKELLRSRDELELRVRERTAELERRNRELQEFAFLSSHDLSEPLRKIQTFGSLLEEKSADRLDEQSRDYVSRMTRAANRMRELLDALLKYSGVDTKGQEFRPTKLDDIAKDAATDLEAAIGKIEAHVEVGPLPMISGDPYQLRQLFQNLIANAVKYHRSGISAVIKIHGEENNGSCRILVEDNGIGFDEEYLDKIFQPFQRLHGNHEYPGTGIGLAICKKIVERHGGTITARSTPGKGSTFIVTLPTRQ